MTPCPFCRSGRGHDHDCPSRHGRTVELDLETLDDRAAGATVTSLQPDGVHFAWPAHLGAIVACDGGDVASVHHGPLWCTAVIEPQGGFLTLVLDS